MWQEPGGPPDAAGGDPVTDEEGVPSDHEVRGLLEAEDLVQRHFQADRPGEIWVSDITYIRTRERWLYLAVVLDLYNRAVVGWSLGPRLGDDLVLTALNEAFTLAAARGKPEKIFL